MTPTRRPSPGFLLAVALLSGVIGCRPGAEAPPAMVVVGIDGGEWSVIQRLWSEGRLPHLRRLAEEGTTARLGTAYGVSPAIWTTIATGYRPGVHGITGFAVPGPRGDVPVSSTLRRVPALWNLATLAGLRVAVLGWYATWPVEEVNGLVLSDHFMRSRLDRRLHPPERLAEIDARLEAIRQRSAEEIFPLNLSRVGPRGVRDLLVEELAPELATGEYDLVLAYFRTVDHLSHLFWDHWEPQAFERLDAEGSEMKARLIPAAYERIDGVIGEIRRRAPGANLLVVSDHGFTATPGRLRISLDMDALLERLGFLARDEGGVDMSRSRAFTHGAGLPNPRKTIRLAVRGEVPGGGVAPSDAADLRRRLARVLEGIRYADGNPVFTVRATPGVDTELVAEVERRGVSRDLFRQGRRIEGVRVGIHRISGGHVADQAGIFLAGGPSVAPGADVEGIDIHDLAPTILYGIGLPVAEDFPGRVVQGLFRAEFRERHVLRRVESWRLSRDAAPTSSEADEEILDELRALGYLQ